MSKEAVAEISASSLQEWQAICADMHQPPLFGSLIVVQEEHLQYIGIVHQIVTCPTDSIHRPFPLQRTEKELLRDYPHMPLFLQTTISCLAVGYIREGRVTLQWPAQPPSLHASVMKASYELYQHIVADHQYLSMIFHHTPIAPYLDELLLAVLARLDEQKLLTLALLERFVEQFSLLSGNDYRRLKLLLQRAERIFSHVTA